MCDCNIGCGCVLNSLKNNKPCFIEYIDKDNNHRIIENCTPTRYFGSTVEISYDNTTEILELDKILMSSYSLEELL